MTTTLTLYRIPSAPDKLFAHLVQSETVECNGVANREAEILFLAAICSSEDVVRDRKVARQLALSELRRPEKVRIEWDDTREVFEL